MVNICKYDVLISGGGLSGLLTAIGLLNETPELSIAIIEPFDSTSKPEQANREQLNQAVPNFDDRCLALAYGSLQLLDHWQVWQNLKPKSWPIETIVTSDRGHIGKTIMRANDYGLNAMGHVAAMKNMGMAFNQTLSQLDNSLNNKVSWYCPDSINAIKQRQDSIDVSLTSGQELSAKLLVVAEGGNSATRSQLNIESTTEKYEQAAIITNVEVKANASVQSALHNSNQSNTAFERFTTSGPIAFLPIAKEQYSVVWSVKPEQVDETISLPEEQFI